MTITKAEILAHLNSELRRAETDIDEHILEALKDLSLQDDFLWSDDTIPTTDGGASYSIPDDCKKELVIKIDNNRPLGKITFREYQVLIADETSSDRDEPDRYAIHGGKIYPYPTPDAVYQMKVYYPAFILESGAIDNITFKDIYRNAIYTKTKAQFCKSKGLKDDALTYEAKYLELIIPKLQKLIQREPRFVKCQDI